MKAYQVEITGITPLLMHSDDIEWSDKMDDWKSDASNKKTSKAGDDRTPAFRWIGSLYHDGLYVGIPSQNIMRALMEGGAMVPVPGGKGGKTFKAQTQSGMQILEPLAHIVVDGKQIAMADINPLLQEQDFLKHKEATPKLGFDLFVKRAKIQQSKHVRVRPKFDQWAAKFTVYVKDEQITKKVLADILSYAGQYKGLCDWRPGSKTPGPYGMFTAAVKDA